MVEKLRQIAGELLETGKADVVIGYGPATLPYRTAPVFITSKKDTDKLTLNEFCHNNLVVYLKSKSLERFPKKAVVAKPCDARSVAALIQENQLDRENITVIGLTCAGMKDGETGGQLGKCRACTQRKPAFCDVLVGEEVVVDLTPSPEFEAVGKFEAMSPDERWEFWREQFSRCIRCYACRAACPMCYCETCIASKTVPQWIDSSAHAAGNLSWHVFRAMHSAGRCVSCGECERVCPVGIPLSLLSKKLVLEVRQDYGYEAGGDAEAKPAMCSFRTDDKEDFIR